VTRPVLYDAPVSGNCLKVRILTGLLGIDHERVTVDIFAGEGRTPEHLARNPAGRTPVWVTAAGEAVPESGAILLLLARGTPLLPDDPVGQARVLAWMFFEQNLLEPNIGGARFWRMIGRDQRRPEAWEHLRRSGLAALEVLERRLDGGPVFLAGDAFTLADLANYAYTHVAPAAGIGLEDLPAVRAWIERVEAVPGLVNDLEHHPAGAVRDRG
jgi:glutathione S-transferase